MRSLRALARFARALSHALGGLLTIVWRFPRLDESQRAHEVQAWSSRMLAHMGIHLRVEGAVPAQGPVLLVSNHISWLDILVIHAARHCRFISKSSVRDWPLIGRLATGAGTLYIERESRRDALRVVLDMRAALERGEIVAVFPEGTTGDGRALLPFHGNLIQAAISADAPVQPLALGFVDRASGRACYTPSWIGDETLLGSIWRTLGTPGIEAVVVFGEPEHAQGRGRREWAKDLQARIDGLRGKPQGDLADQ